MDFSGEMLNSVEKDIPGAFQKILKATKTSSASKLSTAVSMKLNKDIIAAQITIDQLKTEQIDNQKEILRTQQKELNSVQSIVKSELRLLGRCYEN